MSPAVTDNCSMRDYYSGAVQWIAALPDEVV